LSARMGCADVSLSTPVKRVVPISPLADLEPISLTAMNADLRLDPAEIAGESPAGSPYVPESKLMSGLARRKDRLFSGRPDSCLKLGGARGRLKRASITSTSSTV
jgi:hypothetical protein